MNTSFGPRINKNKWDFHDGIDLPAAIGTNVYAMRGGVVHHAGAGGTGGYSSRHVVVEVQDPTDGDVFLVYLHLSSIAEAVQIGGPLTQGQVIGTVGDDDAEYPHLHMEFRKGTHHEIGSVHPLGYLPYPDTANFTPPSADRFNRLGALMAARLRVTANDRNEGDLQRIEVDFLSDCSTIGTRVVDFNDKNTVNEGNGDSFLYRNGIGIEGYQKSNMKGQGRQKLQYGILVCNLPAGCKALIARVADVSGNTSISMRIGVPDQAAANQYVDFEDGAMPPLGWTVVKSTTGATTTAENHPSAAHSGTRGMRCTDLSKTEGSHQRAGIEHPLASNRFEWAAEGWFNPVELDLTPGQSIRLLEFSGGVDVSVAARIHHSGGDLHAGIVANMARAAPIVSDSDTIVLVGEWRKWRLHLRRLGTREATAVLSIRKGGELLEEARLNWDSSPSELLSFRAGIAWSSAGATATILTDELRLTEATDLLAGS
jgi:hypothetical protein